MKKAEIIMYGKIDIHMEVIINETQEAEVVHRGVSNVAEVEIDRHGVIVIEMISNAIIAGVKVAHHQKRFQVIPVEAKSGIQNGVGSEGSQDNCLRLSGHFS